MLCFLTICFITLYFTLGLDTGIWVWDKEENNMRTEYCILFTGIKFSLFSLPPCNSENFTTVNIYFT